MDYQREKEVAIAAVTQAAILCEAVRREVLGTAGLAKGDDSPVTVADFGAQALICRALQAAFPNDPIVGEEDAALLQQADQAATLQRVQRHVQAFWPEATTEAICRQIDAGNGLSAERYWTLDPIDGTHGFLDHDQYAVVLALIEAGRTRVAALACPALPRQLGNPAAGVGARFAAVRGAGVQMAALDSSNWQPIQVNPAATRFAESTHSRSSDFGRQRLLARRAGLNPQPLQMDSLVKYALVARGDVALYLRLVAGKFPDYQEKVWDHAAGVLLVEEAGGRVTDLHGRPLDFTEAAWPGRQGIVASNGRVHDAVLQAAAG